MKRIARCGVLLALCLGPLPAFADTIGINEGHLEMNPSFGPLVLAGDRGFTFQSVVGILGGIFRPYDCNFDPSRCVPGATLSLLRNLEWHRPARDGNARRCHLSSRRFNRAQQHVGALQRAGRAS